MRTCDVMSSPVVSVPPDASLKNVAATLVEHGINAVPVVDAGDRLIGIVSEADLLSLEAGPGRGPAPTRPRTPGRPRCPAASGPAPRSAHPRRPHPP